MPTTAIKKTQPTVRRVDITFMRYRIIAGPAGDSFKALAYIGSERVATSEGCTAQEATEDLKIKLAARDAEMRASRVDGVPQAQEYFEALAIIGMREVMLVEPALRFHAGAEGETTTFPDMARALGVGQEDIVQKYIDLGRRVGRELEFQPSDKRFSQRYEAILALASAESDANGRLIGIRLRPQFRDGLATFESKRKIFRL
jgi:hypothetical protein